SSRSWECQTNSPCTLTSFTWKSFTSATIRGLQRSENSESFSARLTLSMRSGAPAVARRGALARLRGLDLAVPVRLPRRQGAEQLVHRVHHVLDRVVERVLVRLGRLLHPADLADELERGRADLVLGRGRSEVVEGPDVPA